MEKKIDSSLKGKRLDEALALLSLYPSRSLAQKAIKKGDVLVNGKLEKAHYKLEEGDLYMPEKYAKCLIEGGNHAQFGNYGKQRGDGNATVPAGEQQADTVRLILQCVKR